MRPALTATTFDLAAVRIFVQGVELGSFIQLAHLMQCSASAITVSLQKLERQCGQPLWQQTEGRLALTTGGEVIMAYGRRLLALNDEAFSLLHRDSDKCQLIAE